MAPPAGRGEWELRFATSEAAKGWEDLCRQAAGSTSAAWHELRARGDSPPPSSRHHQLKGSLGFAAHRGVQMQQWQFEVTGGGRIWYLVDVEKRTLWLRYAGTAHPSETD
ncbi:hypothetical protein CCUG60884_00331 [Mycobacteroides salmoniphilum]|uniref:Uncharacterized protein n=1 Tax=Mycobacteroides salmoniphilum TaxID=404941 RepID=A0A4R8SZX5_9MYCO|nr:hypothetical protein CCUG60884_00331 [Mycobacteroides salmoniphilum]